MGPSDSSLTNAQRRGGSILLIVAGLTVFYAEALPESIVLFIVGLLGAGIVFLVAPAWITGRWKALRDWLRPR